MGGWFPRFSRPLNDWEIEDLESLLHALQGKRVCLGKEDSLISKDSKDGRFSIKSLHEILDGSSTLSFPFRHIWSSCVLPKWVSL